MSQVSLNGHKPRLLVVEDNPDTLRTLLILLERRGFETISAIDVATGISVGQSEEFDLLLSDIGLPDGSGCDVIKMLRKTKSFPAIALAAYCTLEDTVSCREAGFNVHVSKPYDFTELEKIIREQLGA